MKVLLKLNKGEQLLPVLEKVNGYEVVGFYANSPQYIGTYECGLFVYSLYEAIKKYQDEEISCFILNANQSADAIERDTRFFKSCKVDETDVLIALPEFSEQGTFEHLVSIKNYHRLPYLEYHVADHCNLNCKGCVHFSPLVEDEKFPDYSMVERDLQQLKKLVPYIDKIRILGGEPLLNPELPKYMKLTRETYPYANISVVTNGLLIRSCGFWEDFVRYNIRIDVSLYKPIMNKVVEIWKTVKEKGISIGISEPIESFSYALDRESGHAKFAKRHNCTCPNLYEGGLYVCPIIAYMKYFNKAFGYGFDEMDGRIDIYDSSLNFEQLKEELHKIRKTCDHCLYISDEHQVSHSWSQTTKATVEDYMIDANNCEEFP